jgi:hypothetical protein
LVLAGYVGAKGMVGNNSSVQQAGKQRQFKTNVSSPVRRSGGHLICNGLRSLYDLAKPLQDGIDGLGG